MCSGKGLLALYENFGQVAECDCGTLQVTVGPVSIALDRTALYRLHDLVGAALMKLESEGMTQPKSRFPHSSHLALKKVMKLKPTKGSGS